jgi:ferredoxin
VGIVVNRELCVGSGQCVLVAPRTFDQSDDGLVLLRSPDPDPRDARNAVELCPSGALSLTEDQPGRDCPGDCETF